MTSTMLSKRLGVSLLLFGLAGSCAQASTEAAGTAARKGARRISGPYVHENLTVFLIHGKGQPADQPFLTLQEALQQRKVTVHETGQVNQLAVENRSDTDVYIQAGDIVKGGRQDRMISQDLIVPARSGKVSIGSFCVEQGRWSPRGSETAVAFDSAAELAVGRGLKIAARESSDQGQVWSEVARAQGKLEGALGASVKSPSSASSLQLTLEDGKVRQGAEAYVKALTAAAGGKADVVGAAFVVNGNVSSAEIYSSRGLFTRLWPKLLRSAAVEAVAERGAATAAPPSPNAVKTWIAEADRATSREKALNARVKLVTRENGQALLFETRDRERKDAWVHRSYVAK
jgi:hypothetical protein